MVKFNRLSRGKINLMLRIVGQRDDGYHNLQTCFQLLEWGDLMTFNCINPVGSNAITIKGFPDLKKENNLICQAADALLAYAQIPSDWEITVKKNIPVGSGLGGGSSNAAETLKLLNEQWGCGLSQAELIKIGGKLGADVPIFISGQSAVATGIGDCLDPKTFETPYILLIFPEVSINTATLFNQPGLMRKQVELLPAEINQRDLWINDFFPVVLHQNTAIKTVYDLLKSRIDVRLSGTGSTMFALFNSESEAKNVFKWADKLVKCLLVRPKIKAVD